MKLSGKVAIVTGGASGIGRATAIAFARESAKVVVADVGQRRGKETAEAIRDAEWDRVMSINLKAAFLAIKPVVPHLLRIGGGATLNTSSIGSTVGQLKTPAYIASKGAIALLTKPWRCITAEIASR